MMTIDDELENLHDKLELLMTAALEEKRDLINEITELEP